MPNDAQRVQMVKCLVDNGYKEKVFLSHDIHTKHRMVRLHPLTKPIIIMCVG